MILTTMQNINKVSEKFKQNIEGKCEILNKDGYKYNNTLTENRQKCCITLKNID